MTARRRTGHLRKATNECIRETAMKTIQFSGRLAGLPFVRPTESFTLSFRWKSSLILALVSATSMGCGIENEEVPADEDEDAYTEPYREAVYDLLAEDDPNQTCCYVQVMRYYTESEPGGRRACNVDPHSGPTIPCSIPDEWELNIVDGCPVFVLPQDGEECTLGSDD
jgi:hypothetical protein